MCNHLLQAIVSKMFFTDRYLYILIEFDLLQWDSAGVLNFDVRLRLKFEHINSERFKVQGKRNLFRVLSKYLSKTITTLLPYALGNAGQRSNI